MADKPTGVEGNIHGKPLSADVKHKIQEVLKSTLEHELAQESKTVGGAVAARPRHGSVTHGSVTKAV
jgi:hypothetical protein